MDEDTRVFSFSFSSSPPEQTGQPLIFVLLMLTTSICIYVCTNMLKWSYNKCLLGKYDYMVFVVMVAIVMMSY